MADVIYKRCYFDWGGRCAYCDVALSRQKTGGKVKASIDHFIPLAKGGQNSRANRVLACYPCNLAKNDTDPREIYLSPEVRRFYAAFHQAWPYWLYFANLDTDGLNGMVICCLNSFTTLKVDGEDHCGVEYDPLELVRFIDNAVICSVGRNRERFGRTLDVVRRQSCD